MNFSKYLSETKKPKKPKPNAQQPPKNEPKAIELKPKNQPKPNDAPTTNSNLQVQTKNPISTDQSQNQGHKLMLRNQQPAPKPPSAKVVQENPKPVINKPSTRSSQDTAPPSIQVHEAVAEAQSKPQPEPPPEQQKPPPWSTSRRSRSAARPTSAKKENPMIAEEEQEWDKEEFLAWISSPKEDFGRAKELLGFRPSQ